MKKQKYQVFVNLISELKLDFIFEVDAASEQNAKDQIIKEFETYDTGSLQDYMENNKNLILKFPSQNKFGDLTFQEMKIDSVKKINKQKEAA